MQQVKARNNKPEEAGAEEVGDVSPYRRFYEQLCQTLPAERLVSNSLAREVMSRDASLYRLLPRLVVLVRDEREVKAVLSAARAHNIAITFRAAGTSLSGQAVTDSVLVQLDTPFWRKVRVSDKGARIALGPSTTGGAANAALAPFGRKIGPDPASVASAQIGGIVANNASGMCCGTEQNSYRTIESLRLILFDGTILDTGSEESRRDFRKSHTATLKNLSAIAKDLATDNALRSRVIEKYKMKNTMGYGLNAFLDYDDPIDMLEHVVVGSEGSLAFVSEVRYRTVVDARHKAACILFFPDFKSACQAVVRLCDCEGIAALEIADREAFRGIQHVAHFPAEARAYDEHAAFLLLDVHADDAATCAQRCEAVVRVLEEFSVLFRTEFVTDAARYSAYWAMRKEMYPSLGKSRAPGTFFMQEDLVFPLARLAEGAAAFRAVFDRHGYRKEGIIFGHARDGNLHACLALDLSHKDGVARYAAMVEDLVETVVDKFDGALKGEHGTGRNMAPFVVREWGQKAFALMKRVKTTLDPIGILNPGVVINEDPSVHLAHLKTFPQVQSAADACTECGFCERVCPTANYTMTPRQRVVALRRRAEKKFSPEEEAWFRDAALESCVGDSLCHTVCPVDIDTGELMRLERAKQHHALARWLATRMARNMALVFRAARLFLGCLFFVRRRLGLRAARLLHKAARMCGQRLAEELFVRPLRAAANGKILPLSNRKEHEKGGGEGDVDSSFVFFPSCASRVFGVGWDSASWGSASWGSASWGSAGWEKEKASAFSVEKSLASLCCKGGVSGQRLAGAHAHCCGLAFRSKGFFAAADAALEGLYKALPQEVRAGKKPLLCDAAPCALRLQQAESFKGVEVLDAIVFAKKILLPRLTNRNGKTQLKKYRSKVTARFEVATAVLAHLPCASRRAGLEQDFLSVLAAFSSQPPLIAPKTLCCGFGGDVGLKDAALNRHALAGLIERVREQKEKQKQTPMEVVSASRTCEIGLEWHLGGHSGTACHSLFEWLDRRTQRNKEENQEENQEENKEGFSPSST